MSETINTTIIEDAYAKFGKGDIPGLLTMLTDDVQWTVPEIENAPFSGSREGVPNVERFFKELVTAEDITRFEPLEFIAQNDKVVVLGESAATVRETGRSYETDWVHIFTLREGKVSEFTEFFDNAAATRAFQKTASA
jgi:uncharacterized protein